MNDNPNKYVSVLTVTLRTDLDTDNTSDAIRQHSTISELLTDKIEGLKFDSSLTLEVSKIESFLSDDRSLRSGKCR